MSIKKPWMQWNAIYFRTIEAKSVQKLQTRRMNEQRWSPLSIDAVVVVVCQTKFWINNSFSLLFPLLSYPETDLGRWISRELEFYVQRENPISLLSLPKSLEKLSTLFRVWESNWENFSTCINNVDLWCEGFVIKKLFFVSLWHHVAHWDTRYWPEYLAKQSVCFRWSELWKLWTFSLWDW